MNVVIRHTEGCPNVDEAEALVREALRSLGMRADVRRELVGTQADAERLAFPGSPSIHVDGTDLFPADGQHCGLSCRLYEVADRLGGTPSAEQTVLALSHRFKTTTERTPA